MAAFRCYYFHDGWNYLDFSVASVSIVDTWILPVASGGKSEQMGAFRVFRILKLLRMVKMMRIVPELMVVVEGLLKSLQAMFWIFMLLLIALYSAAIVCVETIGQPSADYPAGSNSSAAFSTLSGSADFNNLFWFGG